VPSGRFT